MENQSIIASSIRATSTLAIPVGEIANQPFSLTPSQGSLALNRSDQRLYYGAGNTWNLVDNGIGDVLGPGSSTNNALVRFSGTSGSTVKNSTLILDDSSNLSGINTLNGKVLPIGAFGDVLGGSVSTDNAITRYSGPNGKLIKNSSVTISDGGDFLGINTLNTLSLPSTQFGNVRGPGSATNNALARYDLSTGLLIKNSVAILDDVGNLSGILTLNGKTFPIGAFGDVVGPASATNLAIPRFNSNSGKLIQDSTVLIDNSANISGILSLNGLTLPPTQFGNVRGPAGATNLAVARYNSGSGLLIQDSSVLISNAGDISGILSLNGLSIPPVQFGNVLGPSSATNLAVARYNAGSGKVIQDSSVLISNAGDISGILTLNTFSLPPVQFGNVLGPASATDNSVALFNSTTGKIIKNSPVLIDPSGNLTGVGTINGNSIFSSAYAFMNSTLTPGTNISVLGGNRWIFAFANPMVGFTFGSGQLTTTNTGIYEITWGYNQANLAQHIWALCVNGVATVDSAYSLANNYNGGNTAERSQTAHGTVVISLTAGDTIGVINPTVNTFTIAGAATGTLVLTLTFYLTIHRIA